MSDKRFTMCFEQNDINGWTMSIVDWQTKEPFNYTTYEVHSSSINDTKDEMEDLCLLLNELNDENKKLKIFLKAVNEELDLANRDYDTLEEENEQLKKENYKLHKRLGDFEQFEEHIKERTSKTFVKECVYFDSVLGVCNIDGSVNCPCENYEELVRWIDD